MVISAYQVNNVLRVYGDQLRSSKFSDKPKSTGTRSPDRINISVEAKRKAVIDKIANSIVDKISKYDSQNNVGIEKEVSKNLENEYGVQLDITRKSPTDLIFKVIDENGETKNSLSINDSKFSKYQLEEITNETFEEENMMY